ncbi:MAG: hypothetical protein ACRCWJ_06235 [Casimicrobium sp.]
MIKLPTYMCSYEFAKSETPRFIGKHEIPLYRAHIQGQRIGVQISVTTPPSGLAPEFYWCTFASVEDEYTRLTNLYGPAALRLYPVVDEMRTVIEGELERVARNKGVNPNAPKEVSANKDVTDLVESLSPALAKNAKPEEKAARKSEAEKVAIQLHLVGLASVPDIANAPLSQLCLAPQIDSALAVQLRDAAQERAAQGNDKETAESRSLDLGALAGRTLEG